MSFFLSPSQFSLSISFTGRDENQAPVTAHDVILCMMWLAFGSGVYGLLDEASGFWFR